MQGDGGGGGAIIFYLFRSTAPIFCEGNQEKSAHIGFPVLATAVHPASTDRSKAVVSVLDFVALWFI